MHQGEHIARLLRSRSEKKGSVEMKITSMIIMGLISLSCNKGETTLPDLTYTPKLPDTGQSISYTDIPGEDSDFLTNFPSYIDNNDGTVTDNITGLMWQKTDGGEMTFEKASVYIDTFSLGGYSDWRLPTGFELFGLNSYDKVNPALNTNYFMVTGAEYWWSSEKRVDDNSMVWVVNAGGGIGAHPKSETISGGGTRRFHIRAVRRPDNLTLPVNHFKDIGDGTVYDFYTGLTWQKLHPTLTMSWEEALDYASGLSLAGKTDWRLPDVKELQSLNDPQLFKPSFNKTYFSNSLSGNFWSSTTQVNSSVKAWDINIDYGIVSYNDKTVKEYVLCVRGGLNGNIK
jgi:hypothetical protein